CDRMPRYEPLGHATEHCASAAHHIALGAADVSQHRVAKLELCQLREQFFHGKNRHGELDHLRTGARLLERVSAAIDDSKLDRQFARPSIQVETDHFPTQV